MYTIEACTVFKNKFTWFQYSKNNHDNRLAWSVKSFTWLDGFDVSASRVPTGLKAEVRAAVGRLIQTDSHVTVIHLMERQWTEEMLPEAGDHVIASCRETPDLWCSDAYGAFTRILTVCIKFPHTHTHLMVIMHAYTFLLSVCLHQSKRLLFILNKNLYIS